MSHERVRGLVLLGRFAEAMPLVVSALASDPDNADLMADLAQCQLGLDQHAEALTSANRYLAQRPDDGHGHLLASLALNGLKQWEEATDAAATAVRLSPNQWRMHAQYALTATHARGRLVEARDASYRAVQLAPNEADAHFVVGVVAQERREDGLARAAYQRTLTLDPQHAQALNNLTVLDGRLNLGRSVRGFSESLRLEPQDALVRSNIEGLAASFVRRIYFAGLLALIIGMLAAVASKGPSPVTVLVALALVIGGVVYTVHLGGQVPSGVRTFVLARMRRDPFLLANEVLTAAMVVVALVVCLVPDGHLVGLALLRPIGLANVALVVWSVARASR